jgi:alkylation response protein AidB-like acyl-CoA dehydrogenase
VVPRSVKSFFAPMGKAAPANGGFRISGKLTSSSGVDNADWLLLGVFLGPPSGGSPMPDIRYAMLPKGDYKVIDDRLVFGLRGTGSKAAQFYCCLFCCRLFTCMRRCGA